MCQVSYKLVTLILINSQYQQKLVLVIISHKFIHGSIGKNHEKIPKKMMENLCLILLVRIWFWCKEFILIKRLIYEKLIF